MDESSDFWQKPIDFCLWTVPNTFQNKKTFFRHYYIYDLDKRAASSIIKLLLLGMLIGMSFGKI